MNTFPHSRVRLAFLRGYKLRGLLASLSLFVPSLAVAGPDVPGYQCTFTQDREVSEIIPLCPDMTVDAPVEFSAEFLGSNKRGLRRGQYDAVVTIPAVRCGDGTELDEMSTTVSSGRYVLVTSKRKRQKSRKVVRVLRNKQTRKKVLKITGARGANEVDAVFFSTRGLLGLSGCQSCRVPVSGLCRRFSSVPLSK